MQPQNDIHATLVLFCGRSLAPAGQMTARVLALLRIKMIQERMTRERAIHESSQGFALKHELKVQQQTA